MSGDDGMFDDWRPCGDIRAAIRDSMPDDGYDDPELLRDILYEFEPPERVLTYAGWGPGLKPTVWPAWRGFPADALEER